MHIALLSPVLYSCPPLPQFQTLLIARLDKVVCQLLDCCGRIASNHSIAVVSNENCLCSFDNNNAFPTLSLRSISTSGTLNARHRWPGATQGSCAPRLMPSWKRVLTFLAYRLLSSAFVRTNLSPPTCSPSEYSLSGFPLSPVTTSCISGADT